VPGGGPLPDDRQLWVLDRPLRTTAMPRPDGGTPRLEDFGRIDVLVNLVCVDSPGRRS